MWDPTTYLAFADHRARPFHELLNRVGAQRPRRVVDLGCGPGNLTVTLAKRWPDAAIEALDSSPEMVIAARAAGVSARVGDVTEWRPAADTDVIVSNAVLQWVPSHRELLCDWAAALPVDGWLAVQMPGNFDAPSHQLIRELAQSPTWRAALPEVGSRDGAEVGEPGEYADLLADQGVLVDAWETTYLQRLTGADPVLDWVSGTALRPIRAQLDDERWQRFRADLGPLLHKAYPARTDGSTWFPFRRLFLVAHRV